MQVDNVPISSITPYAKNPRNNAAAVSDVARSIKEFGWQQPIVVDKQSVIIVGHTRYFAALSLGLRKVPIVTAKSLSKAKVKAYRIADNKVGEIATWDDSLLKLELADLILEPGDDEGVVFTGFMGDELLALLDDEPEQEQLLNGAEAIDATTYGGGTALKRSSSPLRYWKKQKLLKGRVFDFGCGTEEHDFAKYDMIHAPDIDALLFQYDTIMCNYVLNVQPTDHLVDLILALMLHMMKTDGRCLIAIETSKKNSGAASQGRQRSKTPKQWAQIIERFFVIEKTSSTFCGFICTR